MGASYLVGIGPRDSELNDWSHDIGAKPAWSEHTACHIVETDEDLIYGDEIPITAGWAPRKLGRLMLFRFEVKLPAVAASPIKNGYDIVFAVHPYALGWCSHEPLKPPKRGDTHLEIGSADESFEAGIAFLREHPRDYWETGAVRTAGFAAPALVELASQQNGRRDALHVFGVCRDAKAFQARLMSHPHVARLLDQTTKRTLRIGIPGGGAYVHPLVAEEGPMLMCLATNLALAGPHDRPMKGRPVYEKVDRIYRDLINGRNVAVVQRERKNSAFVE